MTDFIQTKLPDGITHAYVDSDSIAYEASFAVEKSRYQYTHKETGEKSPLFLDAKSGKLWLVHKEEEAELFGFEFNSGDYEREQIKVIGSEEEVLKAVEHTIKGWLKTVPKGAEWKGYLTEKGVTKTKDIPGLEHRYQGNRGKLQSPTYLLKCREYLLKKPEFSMVKGGYEADAIVIAMAEKKGKKGMLVALDKDLRQSEGTYVVDRSYDPPMILIADGNVGGVWECPIKSKPDKKQFKYTGVGAKWLCFQAVVGDSADGYGGLKGVGPRALLAALEGCDTHKACLEAIYKTFYEPHGEFEYTSWDGQEMKLTPAQMLLQHFNLAYMERSPTDKFTFEKWGMENPDKDKAMNG